MTDALSPGAQLLDATITSDACDASGDRTALTGTTQAETDKFTKYDSCFVLPAGMFVPVAFDVAGAMGPKGMTFFMRMRDLAKARQKPTTLSRMLVYASAALQRGNGRLLAQYFACC